MLVWRSSLSLSTAAAADVRRAEARSSRSATEVLMRPQPLIAVTDVEASSRWYQRLLDCQSAHGGAVYERLVSNGVLVLQLHRFEVAHHHGPIGDPNDKP